GEIFGFLGPNGSGKTTTIRMLTGRLRPTSGRIEVLGHAIPDERDALYPRAAVVGESKDLYERLTGRENLNLFADLRGVPRSQVDAALQRFALADRAHHAVRGYSQGMRQRLLLARAFLSQPDLLFLDEPTRGLDPASARALRAAIRQINGQGCTVFLTTHLMEEAEQLCHRVGLIAKGRLVAQGTPAALRAAHGERALHLTTAEGRARLALDDPQTPDRVRAALAAGAVQHLTVDAPSLEDVFLKLTGEALDAEAPDGHQTPDREAPDHA
ncbi:MAG: ABC transporter ATP-binding protein, partial [Myxococcales bacterium]|nr:ABC transporter ATP-binding protein [Myxococcales bacterium]